LITVKALEFFFFQL